MWEQLTMSERSQALKNARAQGITDIQEIERMLEAEAQEQAIEDAMEQASYAQNTDAQEDNFENSQNAWNNVAAYRNDFINQAIAKQHAYGGHLFWSGGDADITNTKAYQAYQGFQNIGNYYNNLVKQTQQQEEITNANTPAVWQSDMTGEWERGDFQMIPFTNMGQYTYNWNPKGVKNRDLYSTESNPIKLDYANVTAKAPVMTSTQKEEMGRNVRNWVNQGLLSSANLTPEQREAVELVNMQDNVARRPGYDWFPAAVGLALTGTMGATFGPQIAQAVINPVTDAALTLHGAITAPKNIKEGINEIKNGSYGRGALDLGFTALDLLGAGELVGRTGRMLNKAYRAKHAYNTIVPAGYGDQIRRGKEWLRDLWYNPTVDLKNPKWLEEAKETAQRKMARASSEEKKLMLKGIERSGYTSTGDYLAADIKNSGEIADKTRQDAWAIYNGLPQQWGMYIKNADGTYSYDMKKIMEMSGNTWYPKTIPSQIHPEEAAYDMATGAGGGLTRFYDVAVGNKGNAIMRLEDTWDLHPFSRTEDLLGKVLSKKFPFKTYNNAITGINRFFGRIGSKIKYNPKELKKELDWIETLKGADQDIAYEALPYRKDLFRNEYLAKLGEKLQNIKLKGFYDSKLYNFLNKKGKNFEVGMISGGKPFVMRTDIPYYDRLENDWFDKDFIKEYYESLNPSQQLDAADKIAASWKHHNLDMKRYQFGANPSYIANYNSYNLPQFDNTFIKTLK